MDPAGNQHYSGEQQHQQQQQQYFAPPPPASGAGQYQDVPLQGTQLQQPPVVGHGTNYPIHETSMQNTQPPPPPMPGFNTSNEPYTQHPGTHQYDAEEPGPPLPQRPSQTTPYGSAAVPQYNPATFGTPSDTSAYPRPPQRVQNFGDDDPSNPVHYTRDPHKLVAYLIPFPKPEIKGIDPATIPSRFLIYTPPPPPLGKPAEGEKEAKLHKVQRKWQDEVRKAKTSTAKTASWQGVKSKVTVGVSKAMSYTTSSNLDFLGRVSGNKSESEDDGHGNDGYHEGESTHKTVGVEEMVLIYPPTIGLNDQQMREEFVNTMLRTKSKAMRDSVISTGLLPVAYGIDILATLVWPFGGLGEIDTVWAYANIRGAKTARSVTKRLSSSSESGDHEKDKLRLNFTTSQRIELLRRYLVAECHKVDSKLFPGYTSAPTESDVLEAIGWSPKQSGGESKNWEDEQWEMTEVKEDLKLVMHKGAKEWRKWCLRYEKDPVKAMNK